VGKPVRIEAAAPVGGGCINPSARLTTDSGESFFLKWNPSSPPEMFLAEVDGLQALKAPGVLRVPEVLGSGGSGTTDQPGWLLMEFVPQGRPSHDYGSRLGAGLAALHSSPSTNKNDESNHTYGWNRDNFIGSLPQENEPRSDWVTFWRDLRLDPQLRMARERGHFTGGGGRVLDDLLTQLDQVLASADEGGPALIHGDLWSGNFYPDSNGDPVLIDPAVYRGVGEVDLAMMELFGSFPRGFTEAYDEKRALAPEYDAFRRDLYQLYYLLVHVNLFGGGYVSGSLAAAKRCLQGA
jgi:fructosamine-3-kinase